MSDTAKHQDDMLARVEEPGASQPLRENIIFVPGIEQRLGISLISPVDGEGKVVFSLSDNVSKPSPSANYTHNPMISNSSASSSKSTTSRSSRSSRKSGTPSDIDVFSNGDALTSEDEQEPIIKQQKGTKKDKRNRTSAPSKRKSGGSMTAQTMSRLAADLAYQTEVAAATFTYYPDSNEYKVHKRSGIILDSGTRIKQEFTCHRR